MFGILVALPAETRHIVAHRMQIGEVYPLSEHAMLVVTGMGESALPIIKQHAESGQFSTLISLGTAVGLSPSLTTGMICIPDEVVFGAQIIRCDQGLQTRFINALKSDHPIIQKRLAHTPHILTSLEEKENLYHKTHAGVADMESFLIGQEAYRRHRNFLAIRVVLDNMHMHMPQTLLTCCVPNVAIPQLIATVLGQPKLLFTLMSFARYFKQSQKILRHITQLELLQSQPIHNREYHGI